MPTGDRGWPKPRCTNVRRRRGRRDRLPRSDPRPRHRRQRRGGVVNETERAAIVAMEDERRQRQRGEAAEDIHLTNIGGDGSHRVVAVDLLTPRAAAPHVLQRGLGPGQDTREDHAGQQHDQQSQRQPAPGPGHRPETEAALRADLLGTALDAMVLWFEARLTRCRGTGEVERLAHAGGSARSADAGRGRGHLSAFRRPRRRAPRWRTRCATRTSSASSRTPGPKSRRHSSTPPAPPRSKQWTS